MKKIETINIIGLGALGLLYARSMSRALGSESVRFVMNRERYERNKDKEFKIQGEPMKFGMVSSDEAGPADLVLVAVKYPGLAGALEDMSSSVGDDTVIMSVLNGISSENLIAAKFGAYRMINTVAQGMDATKFGDELNFSSSGTLFIGEYEGGRPDNVERVREVLERCSLSCKVEDDIKFRIWSKYMLNVGVNQTCMVYATNYGGVMAEGEPNRTFISAMREVVAVANAEGIRLTEKDLNAYVELTGTLKQDLMPSMAQDRINRKPCEVDAFAGTLIELAGKHGLHVPVNEFLYKRAHEIEAEYI